MEEVRGSNPRWSTKIKSYPPYYYLLPMFGFKRQFALIQHFFSLLRTVDSSRPVDYMYDIYNEKDLRISFFDDIRIIKINATERVQEDYCFLEIYQGNQAPIRIVSPHYNATPRVHFANLYYVVIFLKTANGRISEVYVVHRYGGDIIRYSLSGTQEFVAMTSDVKNIVVYNTEKNQLTIMDQSLGEIKSVDCELGPSIFNGAVSPDNTLVAFFNNYIPLQANSGLYLYNISKNEVNKIAEVKDADRILWKNNAIFVHLVAKVIGQQVVLEEKEVFNSLPKS